MFMRQLQYELLKMFARKRTYIGFGAFLAVQAVVLTLFQLEPVQREIRETLAQTGHLFDEYFMGLTLAVMMIMVTYFLLGPLYTALVAGDVVAKEVEDGTMRMVLARPVSRLRLLTVKWLACAIYTAVLVLFLGTSALLLSSLTRGGLGKLFFHHDPEGFAFFDTGDALMRYVRALALLALVAQVVPAMALMFSCFRMKPAAATILTLSILFIDMVVRQVPYFDVYKEYFIFEHTAAWMRSFVVVTPWHTITHSLGYLLTLCVVFWVIAAARFCTRDFKA